MANLSYLASLSEEIDKFVFETEEEAKELIEKDLGELRQAKKLVMQGARDKLTAHRETILGLQVQLDKAGEAITNSLPKSKT